MPHALYTASSNGTMATGSQLQEMVGALLFLDATKDPHIKIQSQTIFGFSHLIGFMVSSKKIKCMMYIVGAKPAHVSKTNAKLTGSSQENKEYDSVVFLITVNDTWQDCMATVKTLDIAPNTPRNETSNIVIGDCDSGPLVYNITHSEGSYTHTHLVIA